MFGTFLDTWEEYKEIDIRCLSLGVHSNTELVNIVNLRGSRNTWKQFLGMSAMNYLD